MHEFCFFFSKNLTMFVVDEIWYQKLCNSRQVHSLHSGPVEYMRTLRPKWWCCFVKHELTLFSTSFKSQQRADEIQSKVAVFSRVKIGAEQIRAQFARWNIILMMIARMLVLPHTTDRLAHTYIRYKYFHWIEYKTMLFFTSPLRIGQCFVGLLFDASPLNHEKFFFTICCSAFHRMARRELQRIYDRQMILFGLFVWNRTYSIFLDAAVDNVAYRMHQKQLNQVEMKC